MGLRSSAYDIPVTLESTPSAGDKILTNDIEVTAESLGGNSGLFRIWFSLRSTTSPFNVTISKTGGGNFTTAPLKLNGDNNFNIESDGYYRFDVGVVPNDKINLTASEDLTAINDIQIQQIQKGA